MALLKFLLVPCMLIGMKQRSLEEVAAAVIRRRRELGITEIRLLKSTGLDRKTVQGLLTGSRWAQEETRLKVEAALQWAAGSIEDIRDGRDPTPLVPADEPHPLQTVTDEALIDEIRRRMGELRDALETTTKQNAPGKAGKTQEVSVRPAAGNHGEGWAQTHGNGWVANPVEPPGVRNDEDGDDAGELGSG